MYIDNELNTLINDTVMTAPGDMKAVMNAAQILARVAQTNGNMEVKSVSISLTNQGVKITATTRATRYIGHQYPSRD